MRRYLLTLVLFATALLTVACGGDEPVVTEPELSLNPEEVTIAAKGGNRYITVTCNKVWTAESDQPSWCEVITPSGKDNGEIQLTISANVSISDAREATVTVTADTKVKTIKVSQPADTPQNTIPVETSGLQLYFSPAARSSGHYLSALSKIESCMELVNTKFPQAIAENLKKQPILVNQITDATDVVVYHPSSESSPMAGCIEIRNMSKFLAQAELRQPTMLLNYMARQYLDKYATESFKSTLATTYAAAIASPMGRFENNKGKALNKYDSVYVLTQGTIVKINRWRVVAPAKASKEDYFAELTEAYWGANDHYPFDYFELQRYDEAGFALMESFWGARNLTETGPITLPPLTHKIKMAYSTYDLDPYYRKFMTTQCGITIMSSRFVCDEAFIQAGKIVDLMMEKVNAMDPTVVTRMNEFGFSVCITGKDHLVTDIPQNRYMNIWWPQQNWDDRGRGYGATDNLPVMPIGEENIVDIGYDSYRGQSIFVHEFAHCIDWGMDKATMTVRAEFRERIGNALANAKKPENRLWMGSYAIETDQSSWSEYFAEAAQAYFNCCALDVPFPVGHVNYGMKFVIKDRTNQSHALIMGLKEYDPYIYENVMQRYFTDKIPTGYNFRP